MIIDDKPFGEAATLQRQLVADCQRAELSPLEKADAINKLMRVSGWPAVQVAAKLGMSAANVSKLLALQGLSEPIRQAIESGRIAPSAAYELAQIDDAARRDELAEKLLAGKLTRDGLVALRKTGRRPAATGQVAQVSRATAQLAADRSITVAAGDLTLERFIDLLEELLNKARRARTQGFELATFTKMLRDQARAT